MQRVASSGMIDSFQLLLRAAAPPVGTTGGRRMSATGLSGAACLALDDLGDPLRGAASRPHCVPVEPRLEVAAEDQKPPRPETRRRKLARADRVSDRVL